MPYYICRNDGFTPNPDWFNSVEEFLAMCEGCFGEQPHLTLRGEDYYLDDELVLEHANGADITAAEKMGGNGP